jgi:HEAT repeat protein
MPLLAAFYVACAVAAFAQAADLNGLSVLVAQRDPVAKSRLLAALSAETEPARKARLLSILGNLPAAKLATDDFKPYLADADPLVRLEAVSALGRLGGPASVGPLEDALKDENAGVRLAAASALGTLGRAASADALGSALAQDENPNVRAAAAHGLKRVGGAKAREYLRRAGREKNRAVRRALDGK